MTRSSAVQWLADTVSDRPAPAADIPSRGEYKMAMHRRTKSRLIWSVVVVLALVAIVYASESAMTWLRVTLHGR